MAQLLGLLSASPLRSLDDLLAAGRILMLALLAGLALRLTGATLGAINDLPLLGGLLELVGLVSLLQFLARHALRQQKRAELLERIRQLRSRLLG
ncbi:CAAD domain-containing protein [Synechococcus sp. GFB01]|uniref:CAAD domain-containing protein n=1 Tax=Synechococcus sp. GFB01 TaxID=1662190 RepID=UPI00069F46C4|nr:CAAD domain-containing protein [Synechococcus sp. GFB01]